MVTIKCDGAEGVLFQQCPTISYAAACNALTSTGELLTGKDSGCVVKGFTDAAVTCACDVNHFTSAQTRKLADAAGHNFTAPAGYSVSYVSMLQASADSFVSTIGTADDLDASTLTRGWRALATLGALAGAIVFSLLWSHHADYKMKKIAPVNEEKSEAMVPASLSAVKAGKSDGKKSKKGLKGKFRLNTRAKKVLVNAELAIVEESLPRALSSRTFSDRFMEEVKQHHRWFGIIFYFSDSFPRVLRVVSLATNAIVMLFIQSITYNLTNPDDGSCKLLYDEVSCHEPKSPFATGESKCAWIVDSSTGGDGTCVFIEPDKSIRIILFVAIFCAIVTTPIALAADWVVLNVLSAPTLEETPADTAAAAADASGLLLQGDQQGDKQGGAQDKPSSEDMVSTAAPTAPTERPSLVKRKSSNSQLKAYFGMFANEAKQREDKEIMAVSHSELMMLGMKLRRYREVLRPDELEEFNILWGLDAEGKFLVRAPAAKSLLDRLKDRVVKKESVNEKEAVLMDLKRINEAVRDEARQLRESSAPKHEIGKKLLFLFQCDLLPGISGKILELKGKRDSSNTKHVSFRAKVMGWTFLFLLDTGMLFYILLFALTQTGPRQNAWFQSFALWLVVEILLVSTAIVFFTHIVIPSLIMKDLTQIKRRLMDNIRDFNEKVNTEKGEGNKAALVSPAPEDIAFNAANFLFVSTRLARQFPDLKESKIIAQFSTPWPRQSYLHVQNVSKKYSKKFSAFTRSASILLIFFVGNFLNVPPSLQDIIVQMTSTTAIGYIVLIHVQLFEIFPALVILPSLLVALLAHFIIQSSKSDAKIKLARLFPSVNKKKKVQQLPTGEAYAVDDGAVPEKSEGVNASPVGAVVLYGDDESKLSDSDSDYDDDAVGVTVALPAGGAHAAGVHRTRRQSIQTGLDLLHSMQHTVAGQASSSEDSSDETSGSEEGDGSDSEDESGDEDASSLTDSAAPESGEGSEDQSDDDIGPADMPVFASRSARGSINISEVDCQLLHTPLGTSYRSPLTMSKSSKHSSKHSSALSNPILRLLSSSVSSGDDSSCSDGETGDSADGQPARSDSVDSWEVEVLPRRESTGDAHCNSNENLHLPKAVPPLPAGALADAVNDYSSVSTTLSPRGLVPPPPLPASVVTVPCGEVIQEEERSHSSSDNSGSDGASDSDAAHSGDAPGGYAEIAIEPLRVRTRTEDTHSIGNRSISESSSSGSSRDSSGEEEEQEEGQEGEHEKSQQPGEQVNRDDELHDQVQADVGSAPNDEDRSSECSEESDGEVQAEHGPAADSDDVDSEYDLVGDASIGVSDAPAAQAAQPDSGLNPDSADSGSGSGNEGEESDSMSDLSSAHDASISLPVANAAIEIEPEVNLLIAQPALNAAELAAAPEIEIVGSKPTTPVAGRATPRPAVPPAAAQRTSRLTQATAATAARAPARTGAASGRSAARKSTAAKPSEASTTAKK